MFLNGKSTQHGRNQGGGGVRWVRTNPPLSLRYILPEPKCIAKTCVRKASQRIHKNQNSDNGLRELDHNYLHQRWVASARADVRACALLGLVPSTRYI